MENEISNDYISNAVDELVGTFGIREMLLEEDITQPFGPCGDVKKCIQDIAKQLGLPIAVNITYVSDEYDQNAGVNFEGRHIVTTDSSGRGTQGITAQVAIPSNIPLYGTQSLSNFPISVKLRKNLQSGTSTFMTVMAHELSHVVLYSLRHSKKDNEFYTDITAMLLGFADIMELGRKNESTWTEQGAEFTKVHTKITQYGYLSDSNFAFAAGKIRSLIGAKSSTKLRLTIRHKEIHELNKRYLTTIDDIKRFLSIIDRAPPRKLKDSDLDKIILMHQPCYIENQEKSYSNHTVKLDHLENNLNDNFINAGNERIRIVEDELSSLAQEISIKLENLGSERAVLRKYIGIWTRMKSPRKR